MKRRPSPDTIDKTSKRRKIGPSELITVEVTHIFEAVRQRTKLETKEIQVKQMFGEFINNIESRGGNLCYHEYKEEQPFLPRNRSQELRLRFEFDCFHAALDESENRTSKAPPLPTGDVEVPKFVADIEPKFRSVFAGIVRQRGATFQLSIQRRAQREPTIHRFFSAQRFGGLDKARIVAKRMQRILSNRFGMTRLYPRGDLLSLLIKQYVAGFFDGDGCITYDRTIICSVGQSSTNDNPPTILLLLHRFFGGDIQQNSPAASKRAVYYETHKFHSSIKPEYQFRAGGNYAIPLLEIIAEHGIIKAPQAKLALDFINNHRGEKRLVSITKAEKDTLIKSLKTLKENYADVPIDSERLTNTYMAGITDAEGCIALTGRGLGCPKLTICQKSCIRLLNIIITKFSPIHGAIADGSAVYVAGHAIEMLEKIYPFLIGKKEQAKIVLEHRQTIINLDRTVANFTVAKNLYAKAKKRCSELKRYRSGSTDSPSVPTGEAL